MSFGALSTRLRFLIASGLIAASALAAFGCIASAQTAHFSGAQSAIPVPSNLLYYPYELAVDKSGDVFIADYGSSAFLGTSLVLKETRSAEGYAESTIGSGLNNPFGIAVDGSGSVFISDSFNSRVLKETPTLGGYRQTVVADAANNGLSYPRGVAVDASDNLYIADSDNKRVLKETLSSGEYIQSVIANEASSGPEFDPVGVAVDGGGNVYIADPGNNRVLKEAPSSGGYSQSVVADSASGGLSNPTGVGVDASGDVYIADTFNDRVLRETPWSGGYTQSVTPASGLDYPGGVEVDASGNVYIADTYNSRVLEETQAGGNFWTVNVGGVSPNPVTLIFTFDTAGYLASRAVLTQGEAGQDFTDAGTGTCGSNQMYNAGDTCAVDVNFRPSAPGTRMGAVELLDGSGNVMATGFVQGTGVAPQAAFSYFYGNATPPTAVSSPDINNGFYLAIDGSGDLFVTNNEFPESAHIANGSIEEFPASGSGFGSPLVVGSSLPFPQGIVPDGAGNLFALFDADNSYDPNTGSIVEYARTAAGYAPPVSVASGLSYPNGIAIDGAGDLFFASYSNATKDPDSGSVVELPQSGSGYGSPVTLAGGLSLPGAVILDAAGDVFASLISDSSSDADSGSVVEIKKTGNSYASPVTIAGGLSYPGGMAVDPSGNLLVTTSSDPGGDANTGTLIELPATPLGYGEPIALATGLNFPTDVKTDSSGDIFVLLYKTSVYEIPRHGAPSLNFANTVTGSTSSDSPQTVTLENIGNAPLTFPPPASGSNPSVAANFTLGDSTTCPEISSTSSAGTLSSGVSCVYSISFAPTAMGTIAGSLVLTDNSLNATSPNATQSIALNGTGINPSPLTVTLHTATRLYGADNPSLSYTVLGLLNGDTVTVTPSTTATPSSPVGAYPITAMVSGADAAHYSITVVNSTLQVEKAPLYIAAASIAVNYGSTPPQPITYSLSGFVLGQDATSAGVSGAPMLTTTVTNTTPVGAYRIAVQAGTLSAANYYFDNFSSGEGDVVVRKAPLYISAATIGTHYGETPPQLTAYSLSGFVLGQDAASAGVTGAPVLTTTVTPATPVGCYRIGVQTGTLNAANYYFNDFSNGEGNLCVARAPLYVQAKSVAVAYGQNPPPLTGYNLIGFVNNETEASDRADGQLSGLPSLSTSVTSTTAPGIYQIGVQRGTLTAGNYYFETHYSGMGYVLVEEPH